MSALKSLIDEIRACRECESSLPLGPRPILAVNNDSKILIIGQAPGIRVHQSGIPWNDASGVRLRSWLGVTDSEFYDTSNFALVPIGFCYPGTGKGGDLPPRPECATLWHRSLLKQLDQVRLTLLVGRYAQETILANSRKASLTETVKAWRGYKPKHLPLPHPSPRNNRWLKSNPWFTREVVPWLQRRVKQVLSK